MTANGPVRDSLGRRGSGLVVAAIVCLLALALAGCQRLVPILFDGAATGGKLPPTHRVRRDLRRENEELKRELAKAQRTEKGLREALLKKRERVEPELAIERASTWKEALALLPEDGSGRPDWVKAIETGAVAPSSGLEEGAPEQPVTEMDVDLVRPTSAIFSVVYPHGPHTRWLACQNCHPKIFPLRRGTGPAPITMAKIRAGQYCGVCHGKVAFGLDGECTRCHTKVPAVSAWRRPEEPRRPIERAATWEAAQKLLPFTGGMPDWAKALADGVIAPRPGLDPEAADQPVFTLDVDLVPADNPTFRVVFPHATHTARLSCAICHPAIFPMAAGTVPISMAKIYAGQYCGVCHGKVAFAVPTGCPRCHPVFAGG